MITNSVGEEKKENRLKQANDNNNDYDDDDKKVESLSPSRGLIIISAKHVR
jgi:hypothetical protein